MKAEEMADWSDLPRDLYVTSVKRPDAVIWDVAMCSVPMAIGPEVRYVRADILRQQAAEIARLRDALKPFASMVLPASELQASYPDTMVMPSHFPFAGTVITLGHFRRARAAMEASDG